MADRKNIRQDRQPKDNITFGRNPVTEALKSGRDIDKILILKGAAEGSVSKITALAKERGIPLVRTEKLTD